MRYRQVFIDTLAYHLPTTVISTQDIETKLQPVLKEMQFPLGQLEILTGIKQRHWWPEGFQVSDGAITAAQNALRKSNLTAKDLDVVIYGGVCRDYFEPATACRVAAAVGIKSEAIVYDISNACLGVLSGMVDVANRIELGQIKAGIVVSCESAREINLEAMKILAEKKDRETFTKTIATFTGGSGAVAVILTDGSFQSEPKAKLIGAVARNSSQHHDLCRWGLVEHETLGLRQFMATDAVAVLKHGVALGVETWRAFLAELNWNPQDVDRVISHQVGASHRRAILGALEIPQEIDYASFPYLGNMGTVSLPLTAALAHDEGFLQAGHRVGFLGIGSGLNCLMMGIEW